MQCFIAAMDGLSVTLGRAAEPGGEHLVGAGVVNGSGDGNTILDNADGDGIIGGTVGKITSAVDRVDDPPDIIAVGRGVFEELAVWAFFADQTVVGIVVANVPDDYFLTFFVELSNNLVGALYADPGGTDPTAGMIAGKAGSLLSQFQNIFHKQVFHNEIF